MCDSDSDLDSSEDFYRRAQTYRPVVTPPLYYWWYDPSIYKLNSVFTPCISPNNEYGVLRFVSEDDLLNILIDNIL